MFAINTTTTSRRVCFNPKRTEKPCALGFSVRFGLKHTLRCVIWVKSWKLEALIWAGSGVNQKTYFQKKDINTADFLYDNDNENMAIFYLVASAQQAWHYNQSGSHVWEQ